MTQTDVESVKDTRYWSTTLIPSKPSTCMHCLESGSDNTNSFEIDENKFSHSPDKWSYCQPRKSLSFTSSIYFSLLASQENLSPMESPLSSRKRSSQSSSPLPSQKRWSQSSSSVSSKQGSQSGSLHSLQQLSQSTLPFTSNHTRCSYSYTPRRRLSSPSPSTLEPWKGINEGHCTGGLEEPMDWNNYFHSPNVIIQQLLYLFL